MTMDYIDKKSGLKFKFCVVLCLDGIAVITQKHCGVVRSLYFLHQESIVIKIKGS